MVIGTDYGHPINAKIKEIFNVWAGCGRQICVGHNKKNRVWGVILGRVLHAITLSLIHPLWLWSIRPVVPALGYAGNPRFW